MIFAPEPVRRYDGLHRQWAVYLSAGAGTRLGTIKWHNPTKGYVFSEPHKLFIFKPETLAKIAGFCRAATEDEQ